MWNLYKVLLQNLYHINTVYHFPQHPGKKTNKHGDDLIHFDEHCLELASR